MSYTPRNIAPVDPVFLSAYSKGSLGLAYHSMRLAAPSSAAYIALNRAYFYPFDTSYGYSLARWFWQNGATVGTDYIQVGIYDENLNLFRASPRTLSAGTVNALQYANPGIHSTVVTNGNSTTDGTTFVTASVTLKAGVQYLLSVTNSKASAADVISSIDGGPTFTSRSSVAWDASTAHRTSIWSCVPTTDYTGTLTINFGANTQTGCVWVLNANYHVDTATNDGIVQNATGSGNSATALATLAAFGSANNATFGAFGAAATAPVFTPEAGYIEQTDAGYITPSTTMGTVFRPDNDTTVTETLTSGQWGACAVEIKSLGTGAVYVPPMRGWLAIHCNGTTATLFRNVTGNLLSTMYYMQSSVTSGLPAIATLATATAPALYVCGFTSRATV
jgi:hypothetical protein